MLPASPWSASWPGTASAGRYSLPPRWKKKVVIISDNIMSAIYGATYTGVYFG